MSDIQAPPNCIAIISDSVAYLIPVKVSRGWKGTRVKVRKSIEGEEKRVWLEASNYVALHLELLNRLLNGKTIVIPYGTAFNSTN